MHFGNDDPIRNNPVSFEAGLFVVAGSSVERRFIIARHDELRGAMIHDEFIGDKVCYRMFERIQGNAAG